MNGILSWNIFFFVREMAEVVFAIHSSLDSPLVIVLCDAFVHKTTMNGATAIWLDVEITNFPASSFRLCVPCSRSSEFVFRIQRARGDDSSYSFNIFNETTCPNVSSLWANFHFRLILVTKFMLINQSINNNQDKEMSRPNCESIV